MKKKSALHNPRSIYSAYIDEPDPLSTSMQELGFDGPKTIFTFLSGDILEYVFGFLTGLELCRFRRVCKASLSAMDEYMRRVFSVNRIFSPFFTPEQVIEIRQIQSETSLLVSGSAAVQFFGRVNYPGSNLNLYIEEKDMTTLARFIEYCGYKFTNSPSQPSSLRDALEKKGDWILLSPPRKEYWYDDDSQQLMAIFSFVKQFPLRAPLEVQIVVSTSLAIAPIFNFHSTVVMNIITYKTAVSLFPLSSFHLHETLVTTSVGDKGKAGLQKYSARGWTVLERGKDSSLDKYDPPKEYRPGTRHVGDNHSWIFHLVPAEERAYSYQYPLNIYWLVDHERSRPGGAFTHMQLYASSDSDSYQLYHG
ncbi:hypothetical protein DL96DRAFT_1538137 [Flagelloscypha sp. PMI_526]|nr:hypothetical protein DL96DRAFT_1538137 [Flagelloscypha sp. PMI_526]